MPPGSWLTPSDSWLLDSKRLAPPARLRPLAASTSSLKVSKVPDLSSRAYRWISPGGPPSADQSVISPANTAASCSVVSAFTGLPGWTMIARPSMAMTCSASAPCMSPRACRLAASALLIGREAAARSALPSCRPTKPVPEPWAATSVARVRPSLSSASTRCSFSAAPAMVRTLPKPWLWYRPSISAGASLAPMVLEPWMRISVTPSAANTDQGSA